MIGLPYGVKTMTIC